MAGLVPTVTVIDESGSMWLTMQRYGLVTVIAVTGDLDMDTVATLTDLAGRAITPTRPYAVLVVDLSAVSFCGAAGVTALLRITELLSAVDGQLILRDPAPAVRGVLTAAGVISRFRIDDVFSADRLTRAVGAGFQRG